MGQVTGRRRTRNPRAKHVAVHDAALQLFAKHGFESVSVADIARHAGVAVGTVYRLFPNKIELLQSLHHEMEQKFVACSEVGWDRRLLFEKRVTNLITKLLALMQQERQQLSILSMTTDVTYADDTLPGDLVRAKISEIILDDADCEVETEQAALTIASIIHGAVEGAMRQILRRPASARYDDVAHALKNVMLAALRTRFLQ